VSYTTLISTADLASHLSDGWVIVDCRSDLKDHAWGARQYALAHVPGAVFASLNDDLSSEKTGTNGRHPLPPPDMLAATFGRWGIGRATQVVVYDQADGMYAGRLWWSLRYLGHDAVAVLDGGLAKWTREGHPTTSAVPAPAPVVFEPRPRPASMGGTLGVADVTRLTQTGEALLIDARSPERFEGKEEPVDRVPGHIPGAVNHHFRSNVGDDGTMRPAAELRARFEALLDRRAPTEAVLYCGSGVTACHNLLAMEHAGLPGAALYPGSWSEWSSDPSRTVETGPSRKPVR
jgi:thiosulfate/3-mercaptopyruvate sulfurtransferase